MEPGILKLYLLNFSTSKSFKKHFFPYYNTNSEKPVYPLLLAIHLTPAVPLTLLTTVRLTAMPNQDL